MQESASAAWTNADRAAFFEAATRHPAYIDGVSRRARICEALGAHQAGGAEPQPAAVHAVSALRMAADDFKVHAQLRVQHYLLQPTALGLELPQERAPSRADVRNLAIPPRPRELFDCKPTAVCQHR